MVKIPFIHRDKEDKDGDMARAVAMNEAMPPQIGTPDQAYMDSLGQRSYMILDPTMIDFIAGPVDQKTGEAKGKLSHLLPAFSHLNRLTKIKPKEAELMKLQLDYLIMRTRVSVPEHEYDEKLGGSLESLRFAGLAMINDNVEGFKAKVVTEQTKFVDVGIRKQKGRLG